MLTFVDRVAVIHLKEILVLAETKFDVLEKYRVRRFIWFVFASLGSPNCRESRARFLVW
jgi:hypothetical protein